MKKNKFKFKEDKNASLSANCQNVLQTKASDS